MPNGGNSAAVEWTRRPRYAVSHQLVQVFALCTLLTTPSAPANTKCVGHSVELSVCSEQWQDAMKLTRVKG